METKLSLARLYEIMTSVFMLSNFEFSTSMTADDVPGWDSLHHSILIMEVSSEIGRPISTKEAAEQKSIGELLAFINKEA